MVQRAEARDAECCSSRWLQIFLNLFVNKMQFLCVKNMHETHSWMEFGMGNEIWVSFSKSVIRVFSLMKGLIKGTKKISLNVNIKKLFRESKRMTQVSDFSVYNTFRKLLYSLKINVLAFYNTLFMISWCQNASTTNKSSLDSHTLTDKRQGYRKKATIIITYEAMYVPQI